LHLISPTSSQGLPAAIAAAARWMEQRAVVGALPAAVVVVLHARSLAGLAASALLTASCQVPVRPHRPLLKPCPAHPTACLCLTPSATTGFDVDGAVLKVDDVGLQEQLGVDAAQDPK
jgi:hypothetical protein